MSNLDVALAGFWQIARHWKQGDTAKIELSCEAGSLLMQLTAKLGHPDQPHFPSTSLSPALKRKSPSQLRRQERRRQEALNKESHRNHSEKEKVDSTLPVTEKVSLNPEPTKPDVPSFKCNHCELDFKTDKGLKIHIGNAHKTPSLQTPEKERSSFSVEEPTLTLTPLNVSARKGEIDMVEPEEIIDCEVKKTEGIYKCDDCDFQTDVETEMKNHTQIKHIDPTEGCHCRKCNLTLDTNDSLKRHLLIARCKVHIEGVHCEKCNITFITNEHLKKHIQFNHALGPKCHLHSKKRHCREDPRSCHH